MSRKTIAFSVLIALTLLFGASTFAQGSEIPWDAWETKDIARIGDDNTGTRFVSSDAVKTPNGKLSLQIVPSGNAEENKLAFAVTGADLTEWSTGDALILEVNLPEVNALNANTFFMGMGDLTGKWKWVDGVFGKPESAIKPGWNRIRFPIAAAMKQTKADGKYAIYMSFFHVNSRGGKSQMSEPFYLGSAYLIGSQTAATPVGNSEAKYAAEVARLIKLDDETLIDAIARETFDYFWLEAHPKTGLIKDRSTPDSPASIAAVGFGLTAIPIGVDRGWISRDEGQARALLTLKSFDSIVQGRSGFFYHFVDMATGEREWSSEVSTIDTALFIAGALSAGEYFKGSEVESLAIKLYENIDWLDLSRGRGLVMSMGWKPEGGLFDATWNHFDESLLLYILAIGSPTKPLVAQSWGEIQRPVNTRDEYIFLPGEPLFVYQYPQAWIDLRDKEDKYANYFNNTWRACKRNQQFAQAAAERFPSYQNNVWGISASDGPRGYKAYGATGNTHDGTVAPYASIACLPFTPELAIQSIRGMLETYGANVWSEYGFVSAFNAGENWYSTASIGIDQGDILLMIANYQDGFVWKLMDGNKYIQTAMQKIGFVDKPSDYAVTPDFLKANK